MIVFTADEWHLVLDKAQHSSLGIGGFLRAEQTSLSWVTWPQTKGLQKLKEAKRGPPLGHQRQETAADTLFHNADLQNCERYVSVVLSHPACDNLLQ